MSTYPEPRRDRDGRYLLAALTVLLVAVAGFWWAVKYPVARRRAVHRVGRTWLKVENTTHRVVRRVRKRSEQLEAEARKLAADVWDIVDELAFTPQSLPIPPVSNQFYGHGAFMGAAPHLLADPVWRRILAFLMPDVFHDLVKVARHGARPGQLIPMMENNPVMCAYGVMRGVEARRGWSADDDRRGPYDLAGLEWDVFLSADYVHDWEAAKDDEARDAVLRKVVDTMVIGHASSTDTLQEQFGLCQWPDVRKTRKTQMGGVEPGAWMDFFARALQLSLADDLHEAIERMRPEPRRVVAEEECMRFTFVNPLSWHEATAIFREVTGRRTFSVVLEIKSLRSTPAVLSAIVGELNRRDVHVEAVGSFLLEEITGLGAVGQHVHGIDLPGPREILFLHFAGDLQVACDRGQIPRGQSAMFNGASLITARLVDRRYVYALDEDLIEHLEEYRERYDLHLGVYVQEADMDAAAAALLSEAVRRWPRTFELGFAWGGLLDEVAIEAGLGDHRGFGSQRVLQRIGISKPWQRRPARTADGASTE